MKTDLKGLKVKSYLNKIIEGPILIAPKIFNDERGFFYESFNQKKFNRLIGKEVHFKQDNHSKSTLGVLRGLHFQLAPFDQGKLVRCTNGCIFDVGVDLRKKSQTFKSWFGYKLNAQNNYQLWIPSGFAHGFLTLSDIAEVQYKTTNYWNKDSEISLKYNDKEVSIQWPKIKLKNAPYLSEKDNNADSLENLIKHNTLFE